ncbi:MAG: LppP/LprE family lipoprotein [Corynebacterium sp.]|uniref:LppP/LprE family lipoprotein n=1 Tax=Corynebacterium sp. TaxID=1720 RepID=UPI0026E043A4|nr:LppP/LprE family lipoprotein [Corynebacterium sp.]MDO5670220.1 LppP/LprE family lipoprotein [Corynebacterium sp.]
MRLSTPALLIVGLILTACGTSSPAPPEPTLTTAATAEESCRDTALAATGFGRHLNTGRIAATDTADTGAWWHFDVVADHFDPCAQLSWVQLTGIWGQEQAPGPGAGETQSEAVIFFAGSELITEPAPVVRARLVGVERAADNELTVTWRDWGENYFDPFTAPFKASYTLEGTQLRVAGEGPSDTQLDLLR